MLINAGMIQMQQIHPLVETGSVLITSYLQLMRSVHISKKDVEQMDKVA